jgi:hypothetical protein
VLDVHEGKSRAMVAPNVLTCALFTAAALFFYSVGKPGASLACAVIFGFWLLRPHVGKMLSRVLSSDERNREREKSLRG